MGFARGRAGEDAARAGDELVQPGGAFRLGG